MTALKLAAVPDPEEPKTYHGVPVLVLHVGDPIPAPRAPQRFAVRVSPDLARYLLTFNHPDNRSQRPRKIHSFGRDMAGDRWQFTPESVTFTAHPWLVSGQNRLMAVTEAGLPVWLMFDFGWPDEIIVVLDRGTARTTADAFKATRVLNGSTISAIIARVWQYDLTVGQAKLWSGLPTPTTSEALALIEADAERWQAACHAAQRVYRALDRGGSTSTWGAAYYIIARAHPEKVDRFVEEIIDGAGLPNSATRRLRDLFIRRPDSAFSLGDRREPLELIIRAFNGWLIGKSFATAKFRGFPLSRVKSA